MGGMSNAKRDALWALKVLGLLMALLFAWAGLASGDWPWTVLAIVVAGALLWSLVKGRRVRT